MELQAGHELPVQHLQCSCRGQRLPAAPQQDVCKLTQAGCGVHKLALAVGAAVQVPIIHLVQGCLQHTSTVSHAGRSAGSVLKAAHRAHAVRPACSCDQQQQQVGQVGEQAGVCIAIERHVGVCVAVQHGHWGPEAAADSHS